MQRVIVQRRLPIYFLATSGLTVLAGLILYWIDSSGLQSTWLRSEFGIALTIGGIAALIAFLAGNFAIKPNVDRLIAIGAEIRAAGGPPSEAQVAELQAVQRRLRTIGFGGPDPVDGGGHRHGGRPLLLTTTSSWQRSSASSGWSSKTNRVR